MRGPSPRNDVSRACRSANTAVVPTSSITGALVTRGVGAWTAALFSVAVGLFAMTSLLMSPWKPRRSNELGDGAQDTIAFLTVLSDCGIGSCQATPYSTSMATRPAMQVT